MKLTVVFTLVTLALCCYSASALLVDTVGSNLVSNVVSIPFNVIKDLTGGLEGCVNQLTPKALSALTRLLGILVSLPILG